jgi:osmotically-inducible protein OsmY
VALLVLSLALAAAPFAPKEARSAVRELTDANIMETVEKELIMDPAVVLNSIDVAVNQGVVSLTGAVDNILAKERAARVAETVRGVRAVVNRIDVEPVLLRSDTDIARDVEDALLTDSATESFEVQVAVSDGTVTLTGTVDSWQEKRLAGIVAKGVRGVTGLRNGIDVVSGEARPDAEIAAEVEETLRWDELVDHALIEVAVEGGRVRLSGVVGSAAEKRRAMIDAHVTGVTSVDASGLDVKLWARDEDLREDKYVGASDDSVRKAVEDALLYDPRVVSLNVTTRVDDGVVTLRGVVNDLMEKRAAARDARNTVGVLSVKNRLKVRPSRPVDPETLERKATDAVSRDPYLEPYEITVEVVGGTATLHGSVDSYHEKAQAEDVVSRIEGIRTVENKLTVDYDLSYFVHDPYVDDLDPSDYRWYRPEPLTPRAGDAEIREEVEDELWWSPFVDEGDVEVTVVNGRAKLTGEVDSWSEYGAAARNAYEGGAVWVDNRLEVDTAS